MRVKEIEEPEIGIIAGLVAGILELAGMVITAISILGFIYVILNGGNITLLYIVIGAMIVGSLIWWSGKKIKEGSKEGLIPLTLAVLATTPIDFTDPITAALEVLALLVILYLYHQLD